MSETIIGIDLGTTNSEAAVCRNGKVEIIPVNGEPILPSCVGVNAQGILVVGREARNQFVFLPEHTVVSIKRKMGAGEKVRLGEREYLPQEISAMILRELKRAAEQHLGGPVEKAVITVPAYFNDAQRQATREAGAMAGLEVVRILNEPTAACLAYEHHEAGDAKTVLAFDLGGGTFDVSVVHMDGEVVEVLASHGDTHLGGDDFDQILAEALAERLDLPKDAALDAVSLNRLRRTAEDAKIRLTDEDDVRVIEDGLRLADGTSRNLSTELSRSEFEEMIVPLLRKVLLSVRKAMSMADKRPSDIQEVVLVGGATRSPVVSRLLREELGFSPRHDLHPDLAVAYGAGIMAGRLMGMGEQRILVDVTPYTFGTSALGLVRGEYGPHLFCPIIGAGTPLPVGKSETFFTVQPGQPEVAVKVFEGEDEDARKNILIGEFLVQGLDTRAPVNSPIVLRMNLDLDGILTVTAIEKHTGLSKALRIERATDKLSDTALETSRRRIAELFKDENIMPAPDDEALDGSDMEAAGLQGGDDETAEAGTAGAGPVAVPASAAAESSAADASPARHKARVMARRLREKLPHLDPVDREDGETLLARLDTALAGGDEAPVAKLADEIDDLLFYVESGR